MKSFSILLLIIAVTAGTYQCKMGDHFPFCLVYPLFDVSMQSYPGPVDLNKFAGMWYEQARKPMMFQKSHCAYAKYSLDADKPGTIIVENGSNDPDVPEYIKGTAFPLNNDNTQSKLKVRFGLFASGNYWILDMDPEYKIALIGEPCATFLWLLSKDRHLDRDTVNEWFNKAKSFGYNLDNAIYRKDSC